jgi:gliding motility-associated lipoprotein GldD
MWCKNENWVEVIPKQTKMTKKLLISSLCVAFIIALFSCKNEVVPKPPSYLRLDYPTADYVLFENNVLPWRFEINSDAVIKGGKDSGVTITYPKLKATIYLTYKPVKNDIDVLLRDAQKLTYEHVIKADDILEQPFINKNNKVYGMFYQVDGNSATNSQFYVTDSVKHFVAGSLYFYAKPNYDSIMPAASYIRNDMQRLMETLKWK